MHTDRIFEFELAAPMNVVAPLFGAERERRWDSHWDPQFIWPNPASDCDGMVFSVAHDDGEAIWVNTVYDLESGVIQYVYVLPKRVATTVTVNLTPDGAYTRVIVRYERTALDAAANQLVAAMALRDEKAGPDWQRHIQEYLDREAR